ncbi:30S ribosomal protein S13 [Candidatus Woesearchaeota archaeon ex4484_78]|nr:MAG: 30S ribosomal protein S13 [Candidatus Woesearchaeota archaeon ex4484_78]
MAEKTIKHLVRIANTDLQGDKNIVIALKNIKGIGINLANALCTVTKTDKNKKAGELTEEEIQKLEKAIKAPSQNGIPSWMFNRRKDMETGLDKHLITNELIFTKEQDIKFLRKIKCYKGMRHALGLPVRGQRTRSNFRKNKGKAMGVKRAKVGKKAGGKK